MTMSPDDNDILQAVLRRASPGAVPVEPVVTMATAPAHWNLPGFDGKARVQTAFGALPIEALRLRDELRLPDGQFLPVTWIDRIKLDARFLARHPEARPILIGAEAFGASRPARSFLASPGQEVFTSGRMMDGSGCVAAELIGRRHILRKSSCDFIIYHLFRLARPAQVEVEGLWCTVDL